MSAATAKRGLYVVGKRAPESAAAPQATPEDALTDLFAREAELQRQLAEVRAAIPAERERYRVKYFLLMLPGVDTLRRQFGPKP